MKTFVVASSLLLLCVAVADTAQGQVSGSIFTDAAYADSPEIARDRDWLVNYLSAGKTVEETENVRNKVERMSVAHVRSLLRYYHHKQQLDQQREAAFKNDSQVVASESAGQGAWSVSTQPLTVYERDKIFDIESRNWEQNVARQTNGRPRFRWDSYMPFNFSFPFDFSVYYQPGPF